MDKFHSLFLSSNGSVYSCGFGIGGRLGHDNEEPVLVCLINNQQIRIDFQIIDPETNRSIGIEQGKGR